MALNRFCTSVRPKKMPASNYRSMEETAMTNFATPGTKMLAALVAFGVLAAGAYAQQAAAAGNPVTTKPDVQSAGGGYAVDANGQPPSPIGTVPLLYPDRKSTRLNSSHLVISYAVFCLN